MIFGIIAMAIMIAAGVVLVSIMHLTQPTSNKRKRI